MSDSPKLTHLLRAEIGHITAINPSDRSWPMPLSAALSSGLPLLIGAYFDHLDYGLISSLGGMAFLYTQETPLHHRMVVLLACAFGMVASYAAGVISHLLLPAMVPALMLTAIVFTMAARYYALPPPGSFFFVMSASIGAHTPGGILDIPLKVGLLSMGSLLACLIAFTYSVLTLRTRPPKPVPPLQVPSFDFVVYDAVIIGVFVGLSLAVAQLLQLSQPYWVPISCMAVIQGISLRAVWTKQAQRILGTGAGLLLAWVLLSLPLTLWTIPLAIIPLAFCVELLVPRQYAAAAIFFTPMTILLVESASIGQMAPATLIQARFIDTVLGSLVGMLGGACLHHERLRSWLGPRLRALLPTITFSQPTERRPS